MEQGVVNTLVSRGALDLAGLTQLMQLTSGVPEVIVGLVDGPVAVDHPGLAISNIRGTAGSLPESCARAGGAACAHGTFVAGILSARRGSVAPGICPGCTLLVRPIFSLKSPEDGQMPSATPEELAEAMLECVKAGARVINLSVALAQPSSTGERQLTEALDYVARRGVLVVAAAGNQGTLGSSAITRHPCVIPVAGCDSQGRPMGVSNLGGSIGRRGLMAPGEEVTSLGVGDEPLTLGGTSMAAPFVTGTMALLWSEFPTAITAEVKCAVTGGTYSRRRTSVVPPLLDAWAAYRRMAKAQG